MIKFAPLPEVTSQKGMAALNRLLNLLCNSAVFSTSTPPGGGTGSSSGTVWTTVTRPASPSLGTRGYNTDFSGEEVYTAFGWLVIFGTWTTAGRPSGVAPGSQGFNITIPSREYKWGTGSGDWSQV